MRTGCSGCADHLQPLDRQKPLQPLGKFAERERLGQPTPSARALAFRMRHQRRRCRAGQARGQPLVHALAGRIERRVRTVDRDVRGDQVQQQSADGRIGRSIASRP